MAVDVGKLLNDIVPLVVGAGTKLILNNQERKKAQGEANRVKEESDKLYQAELLRQQNLKLLKEASKAPPKEEKSKLPLYIGLGVGGVVVLGVIIFAVTRK